jgi:putative ABC transport system permease protein
MDALRENSRSATATRARQKLRSVFVVVQVSFALVLLIGAGLLMKSFLRVNAVPVGFDYSGLTTFQIFFPQGEFIRDVGVPTPSGSRAVEVSPRISLLSEQIVQRLTSIPGVQAATAVSTPPLFPGVRVFNFAIEGQEAPPPGVEGPGAQKPNTQWLAVMSGYFDAVGVPVVRGRRFNPQDSATGTAVAIISETAAKRYWPNEDPIGKRIKFEFYNDPTREIVGIVGDTKQNLREREQAAQMYIPYAQLPVEQEAQTGVNLQNVTFVVRSTGQLDQIVPAMRAAAAEVIPTVATTNMLTVKEYASRQVLDQWIYTTLLSIFGGIALVLAIVGIYGVMAHSVSQRTSEIGVRMALGAGSMDVLRLVLRRGVILISIGIAIGTIGSFALTRVIQNVLWGVTATDPLTFTLAMTALSLIGLLACYIPARRALKIDPIIALRYE